jgi:hypothetical protein
MARKRQKKGVNQLDPKVLYVTEKFEESKDHYKELREKFTYWDDLYFSVPGAKKWDWMSNLFDPETHKATMTLLSRVVNNTFSVDPPYDVVPSNKVVSDLIRAQLFKGNFFIQWVLFCLQVLIRGTSIGKVSWRKDTKTKFTLEKSLENVVKNIVKGQNPLRYVKKPKQVVKYDGPIFEVIDLFDYFPEAHATKVGEGARIFRSIIPKHQFMRNPNYINKEAALKTELPESEGWFHSRLKSLGIQEPVLSGTEHLPTDRAKKLSDFVQLLECETDWWNPETKQLEPWILTVANQQVLVRDDSFPYWNTNSLYVKGVWIPVLNEFYGMGIPELGECLQEELNDKKNQRIDNVNQVLQPIMMWEEGSISPKVMANFERKPGAKLRTRAGAVAGKQIQWDYCPDVTVSATVEIADLKRAIEEVTGAVRAIQPASVSGEQIHRTSSGLMLLQSMAHEKIKLNLSILEKDVLEPVFEKFYDLNLQFLTPGYRIFSPEGKLQIYSPEMVAGDYEFRAKGSRYALDQQMKIMNLSRVIEALGKSGLPLGELHIKFWMRLYDALGFEDKEEIEQLLRQEIAKFNQQQQQLALAKQAGGQGGGDTNPLAMFQQLNQAAGVDQTRSDMGQQIPGGY